MALEADLADPATVPLLFDRCEAELGPVDVLVNNHTYCVLETFDPARVTDEESGVRLLTAPVIDAHFAVNARAYALLMAEYVQRYLKRNARSGRIINLSTDAAHAHESNVSYAASKHAIESYSRSAASELGQYTASPSTSWLLVRSRPATSRRSRKRRLPPGPRLAASANLKTWRTSSSSSPPSRRDG